MALVVGGVAVDLQADAGRIIGEMNRAAAAVNRAAGQMQTSTSRFQSGFARAERSINASVSRIGQGFRSLQGTLALFGAGLGIREIIRYADSYKQVEAQLRLVTGSAQEASAVQERLFQSAQNLGVGVDALNTIFIRTARNAESLGISQEETIQVTEALAAAVRVSGASAAEAQNSLIQLSQSFASGVLRGDELRSIGEQLPVVLDAVAEATGKTRQEVINFARENGLAADLVIESVSRMRDTWVQQAATMGDTVETAMTRIDNAIRRVAGKAGEAGAFQPLIDSLNNFANTLEDERINSALAGFAAGVIEAVDLILKEFADLANVASAIVEGRWADAFAFLQARVRDFGEAASAALEGDYANAVNAAIGRTEALGKAIDQAQINASFPPAALAAAASRTATAPPLSKLELRGGGAGDESAQRLADNIKDARESIATLITSSDEFTQIQQQVDNRARQLGETFRNFSKYITDPDERLKAFNATLAALAVEQAAANQKIKDTVTNLRQIAETAGLGELDFGKQDIRDAVTALGEMAGANDKVFATQLALTQTTARLSGLFSVLSDEMRAAGASADEIARLQGVVNSIQKSAEREAAAAARPPSPFQVAAFEPPAPFDPDFISQLNEQKKIDANNELIAQYATINAAAATFSQTLAKGFTDAITGAQTFGDALRGIVSTLLEAVLQAIILQTVTSAIGTAGGGGILGSIFSAQPRALGGPVGAYRPYMVGERGPELFVPSRAGQIVSNSALGGGGGSNVINIDARQSTPGTAAAAVAQAVRLAPNAVANAGARGMMGRGRAPF